jgi:hypothetical protein
MAHFKKGCESVIDRTDSADTMHDFDGTLHLSVLDALHESEPEDTSGAALDGAASTHWIGSHAIAIRSNFERAEKSEAA